MNRNNVCLLDLPDEILLIILQKLNNLDVLYSLFDINDERLDILVQDEIFSAILNFGSIDNDSSTDRLKLDRLCNDILPRIRDKVKYLILKPVLTQRILLATDYPNLTNLKILNFKQEILYYLTGKKENEVK